MLSRAFGASTGQDPRKKPTQSVSSFSSVKVTSLGPTSGSAGGIHGFRVDTQSSRTLCSHSTIIPQSGSHHKSGRLTGFRIVDVPLHSSRVRLLCSPGKHGNRHHRCNRHDHFALRKRANECGHSLPATVQLRTKEKFMGVHFCRKKRLPVPHVRVVHEVLEQCFGKLAGTVVCQLGRW